MPTPNPAAMEFLLTRRSRPAKTLSGPTPDRADLLPILTAGARTPDHGKLEPWRFIVLEKNAMQRLAKLTAKRGAELNFDEAKIEKSYNQFASANLAIAVVASPKASEKVPRIEQELSAGAVCLSLLNAALASGWGANWLSNWMAFDRDFLTEGLELAEHEYITGYIHIGTETSTPPERPRPDLDAITTWVDV
ncbi:nitroreductase family protein [Cochlodiniinecator piscidefendens]|uniref:nitroreductase family protein n=1 Tax=Cochlodiniinecator piscidefendens TaxID=2715756 RepID=UPI001407E022|nr:nitroreductase [Cochlodiniinecator piscidefendens]